MLKVAVVGVGFRAGLVKLLPQMPGDPKLVVAVDPNPAGRERGLAYGAELVVDTVEELAGLGIDAAIITSPDHVHADQTIALLKMGIPVFLEKPIAIDLAAADLVLATAYETGTKLYVGHNMRHMQVIRVLKQLIDDGAIGEVKTIWCRHFVGNGGDFYFHDWHAERAKTGSLLLQKAAHDIDVIHYLAGGAGRIVTGMGDLMVYGSMGERRGAGESEPQGLLFDWYSHDSWPPETVTGLNPIIDVEDVSMLNMRLDNGVLASYQQCHFSPDYWRNYTVIGTRGRIENFGDGVGAVVKLWNKRGNYRPEPDAEFSILQEGKGHSDADVDTLSEFFRFIVEGIPTATSPVAARDSVAVGLAATKSLRNGSVPQSVEPVSAEIADYFASGQSRRNW